MDGARTAEIMLRGQLEVGEDGTPHYQLTAKTKKPWRLSRLVRETPGVHWSLPMKGQTDTPKAMLAYCSKVDTRAGEDVMPSLPRTVSIGEYSPEQGARKDVSKVYDFLKERVAAGADKATIIKETAEQFPDEFIRMHSGIEKYLVVTCKRFEHDVSKITPWPVQNMLLDLVDTKPSDRQVHLVVDPVGGAGKSVLVKLMLQRHGERAVFLQGEYKDMAYVMTQHPNPLVVLIDFTRVVTSSEWTTVIAFVENLKNGMLVSGKYVPQTLRFAPPHVVILCNGLPAGIKDMLSGDRPVIWAVRPPKKAWDGSIVKQYTPTITCGFEGKQFEPFAEFTRVAGAKRPRADTAFGGDDAAFGGGGGAGAATSGVDARAPPAPHGGFAAGGGAFGPAQGEGE